VLHVLFLSIIARAVPVQRCVDAAKAVFKAIAVSEPRVRGAAKAALREALQQRFNLLQEAALARGAAGVDSQLLKAAQQISTVRAEGLEAGTDRQGLLVHACVCVGRWAESKNRQKKVYGPSGGCVRVGCNASAAAASCCCGWCVGCRQSGLWCHAYDSYAVCGVCVPAGCSAAQALG